MKLSHDDGDIPRENRSRRSTRESVRCRDWQGDPVLPVNEAFLNRVGQADEAITEVRTSADMSPDGPGLETLADILIRRRRVADARTAARPRSRPRRDM